MRVALIVETFLPHMSGVTGSVLQVLQHLKRTGHEAIVVAPAAEGMPDIVHGARIESVLSIPLPGYPDVRVAAPRVARLERVLDDFGAEVVHLASPFALGARAATAADRLRIASVAVFQTDVAAYAARYGVPRAASFADHHIARLHRRATMTLAPSSVAHAQLESLGIDRVRRWGRGVDTDRFRPARRSAAWREQIAPGQTIVGYVGRLAPEKQVDHLRVLSDLPDVQLVIVGDGPSRPLLEATIPKARFLGHLSGEALAEAVASFDVFVHPGESETFGQTIQEALASGVPVVATGSGGPVDLVSSSVNGWLYSPGDLGELRDRVLDLTGDSAKRRAFGEAAHASVASRTWPALCDQLLDHYRDARELRRLDSALLHRSAVRPELPPAREPSRWRSFVALGDSITEGLCDTSRMPAGKYRGWADRFAELLAHAGPARESFRYANLAVRSRRVADLRAEQLPRALEMKPDLVSILIGANDLVRFGAPVDALAEEIRGVVQELRAAGSTVLLVTPFLPRRRISQVLAARFGRYAALLRGIASDTGAILLDLDAHPEIGELDLWADDKVHLRSRGHRFLAYRAADALGVPHADALAGLDDALHDVDAFPQGGWLRRDAVPWLWRRLRGKTAGDGLAPKHDGYIELSRSNLPVSAPADDGAQRPAPLRPRRGR